MKRYKHTAYCFNWRDGNYKLRRLSRSFHTLEEAEEFASDKAVIDIYRSKGMYRVEWVKRTDISN